MLVRTPNTIDLSANMVNIGDTTEFVAKFNTFQSKIQQLSSELPAYTEDLEALAAEVEQLVIDANTYSQTQIDQLLAGKVGTGDARLSNAREWSASTVSQVVAEAGTGTARTAWTAQRVWQAIGAFFLKYTPIKINTVNQLDLVANQGYAASLQQSVQRAVFKLNSQASDSSAGLFFSKGELSKQIIQAAHSDGSQGYGLSLNPFGGYVEFLGETYHHSAMLWRVSPDDAASQRADALDDGGDRARLYWYGQTDQGATDVFRQAWYGGNDYVMVDVAGTTVDFKNGSLKAGRGFTGVASNASRVVLPAGAVRGFPTAVLTGAIKVLLPGSWTDTMIQFTIDVYNYNTGKSFQVRVAGYNYSSGSWLNTTATIIGGTETSVNYNVRFGHDGTNCCIYIGETNSGWDYLQVGVSDVQVGFNGSAADNWNQGWDIGVVTGFGSISVTHSLTQLGRFVDGQEVRHAGNTFEDASGVITKQSGQLSNVVSQLLQSSTATDARHYLGLNAHASGVVLAESSQLSSVIGQLLQSGSSEAVRTLLDVDQSVVLNESAGGWEILLGGIRVVGGSVAAAYENGTTSVAFQSPFASKCLYVGIMPTSIRSDDTWWHYQRTAMSAAGFSLYSRQIYNFDYIAVGV